MAKNLVYRNNPYHGLYMKDKIGGARSRIEHSLFYVAHNPHISMCLLSRHTAIGQNEDKIQEFNSNYVGIL